MPSKSQPSRQPIDGATSTPLLEPDFDLPPDSLPVANSDRNRELAKGIQS